MACIPPFAHGRNSGCNCCHCCPPPHCKVIAFKFVATQCGEPNCGDMSPCHPSSPSSSQSSGSPTNSANSPSSSQFVPMRVAAAAEPISSATWVGKMAEGVSAPAKKTSRPRLF